MLIYITPRLLVDPHVGSLWAVEQSYLEYFKGFYNNLAIEIVSPYTRFETKGGSNSFLVLTGGNDVSPKLYGEENSGLSLISAERDAFEFSLIKHAISQRIPILGICRGMQLLNVYFGGKLTLNLKDSHNHSIQNHLVDISVNATHHYPDYEVNSFHEHGVEPHNLGTELKAFATCDSNRLVEGLYHSRLPIAGILWHPERGNMRHEFNHFLISAFLNRELFWSSNVQSE
jgi:gamma-glutamyl-gamma-aminobutyrate hydrolase PuuD